MSSGSPLHWCDGETPRDVPPLAARAAAVVASRSVTSPLAGVSPITASRALNTPEQVAKETLAA
jgi:hypothetical protein